MRDLLISGTDRLGAAGVDTPELDAEVLLAHALGTDRSRLLARLSEQVPQDSRARYEALISRREALEPVAYIRGRKEFWGREFEVSRDVLIPRPETELLVERALAGREPDDATVTDVGTGSGCVAVTLALERPRWRVYGLDTSLAALELAQRNAGRLGAQVHFVRGSLLEGLPEPADLVVANLPYVPGEEIATLQPEVSEWEPREALDGGADGLDVIRALLPQLPGHTTPRARCLLELDPRQYEPLAREVGERLPGWGVRSWRDLAGHIRVAELTRNP